MASVVALPLSPKQLLTSCFRRLIEYRPATASTRALRVMRARCRWAMSLTTVAERLDQGAPRFIRRLNFDRGTRRCCLRLIERTGCASLTAISAARVLLTVPVSSWSCRRVIKVDAEPSRLDGHGALQLFSRLLPSAEMRVVSV